MCLNTVLEVYIGIAYPTLYARISHLLEHPLLEKPRLSDCGVSLMDVQISISLFGQVWGSVQGSSGRSGRADHPDNVSFDQKEAVVSTG